MYKINCFLNLSAKTKNETNETEGGLCCSRDGERHVKLISIT